VVFMMISLFILRTKPSIRSIFVLFCNAWGITNSMPNSLNLNSGWIVWNSWVTLFPKMVSPWILGKCRRS
jgi:hypothetical protein